MSDFPCATDADLACYREATASIGVEPIHRSGPHLLRRLRFIGFALRETRGCANAVSKAYGVGRVAQVFGLADAHFHTGMGAEDFYLTSTILPKRRPSPVDMLPISLNGR